MQDGKRIVGEIARKSHRLADRRGLQSAMVLDSFRPLSRRASVANMLFKARSAAVYGIDAHIIDVEVDFSGVILEKS